jgi:hypothetical protein
MDVVPTQAVASAEATDPAQNFLLASLETRELRRVRRELIEVLRDKRADGRSLLGCSYPSRAVHVVRNR